MFSPSLLGFFFLPYCSNLFWLGVEKYPQKWPWSCIVVYLVCCDGLLTCSGCIQHLTSSIDYVMFPLSYQFLEDAFKNHKQHMESMSHHLQEKKKLIEDLSNSIDNRYVFHSFSYTVGWIHMQSFSLSIKHHFLYKRHKSLDHNAGNKSDSFPVGLGLHQSCPLSSIFFINFMNIMSKYSQGAEGIWFGALRIKLLLFADDVVSFASSSHNLKVWASFLRLLTTCPELRQQKLTLERMDGWMENNIHNSSYDQMWNVYH